jgi:GntR family transcriptional regulator
MDASMLNIQPSAPEPIYRQILEQLRRLIAAGQFAEGERLPSVREVAVTHAVNPMTVSRAYSLAEAEGLLERLRGKGMVVAAQSARTRSQSERLALLELPLQALSRQVQELELPAELVLRRLGKLLGE